jgi:hypothetical protein
MSDRYTVSHDSIELMLEAYVYDGDENKTRRIE